MNPIHQIVARHDSPRISLFDSNLERLQVNLPQRPLRDVGVHCETAGFLLIRCEMLDRSSNAIRLEAIYI